MKQKGTLDINRIANEMLQTSSENEMDRERFGTNTHWEAVRAYQGNTREWLAEATLCPLLRMHQISHVGRMWAQPPFELIRKRCPGTLALIGLDSEGETLVDGDWQTIGENEIYLLPAFKPIGIRAKPDPEKDWEFAWVQYEDEQEDAPNLTFNDPVIQSGSGRSLSHAIAGLVIEAGNTPADQARIHYWVELIHSFVVKAAGPYQGDDRLLRIWHEVEQDLPRTWTLSDLAKIGHLSSEHLRRLSHQQLGRSPIQQVTHLRMKHAVWLLSSTDAKVETVAKAVGYSNPFTFSNAFKRWIGKRPSDFRE